MRQVHFIVAAGVLMSAPCHSFAATLHLSPTEDGLATTGDAASIQAALDMTVDGDTVELEPGTYYVNELSFPRRSITLSGSTEAPETVILDGSGAEDSHALLEVSWNEEEPPLNVEEWPTVKGLTLQRSVGIGLDLRACQLKIEDIVVKDNHWTGIDVNDSFVSISGSRIEGNQFGGISASYSNTMPVIPYVDTLQIVDSRIAHNDALEGGGLYYFNGHGGLVLASVSSCTFEANSADLGGGIFANSTLTFPLRLGGVSVIGNQARLGGGVFSPYGGLVMTGGELSENVAGAGGGMYGSSMDVGGVRIIGNEADEGGGAVFHGDLRDVEVSGNKARIGGGLVFSECITYYGYACGDASLFNIEIRENQATELGGGLVVGPDNAGFGFGATVKGVVIEGNTAPEAAGVWSMNNYDLYEDVTVADNSASGSGGGMWLSGDQTLERVVLVGNSASSGAALYGDYFGGHVSNAVFMWNEAIDGGGLYLKDSTAVLENVTIASNSASGMGGGMFVDQHDYNQISEDTRWLGLRFSIAAFNSALEGANLYSAGEERIDFNTNLFYSEEGLFDHSGSDGIWLPGDTIVEDPHLMVEGNLDPQVPQLGHSSPAVNAGPPTWRDADGSLLDLGATGGEKADQWGIACEDLYTWDDDEACPELVPLMESGGCTMVPGARPPSAGIEVLLCALGLAALRRRAIGMFVRRNPAPALRLVAPCIRRSG